MWNPNPLKRRELISKLKKLWFSGPFSWWNHEVMFRNNIKIAIPNPHWNQDIWVIIINKICKHMWVGIKEFMDI